MQSLNIHMYWEAKSVAKVFFASSSRIAAEVHCHSTMKPRWLLGYQEQLFLNIQAEQGTGINHIVDATLHILRTNSRRRCEGSRIHFPGLNSVTVPAAAPSSIGVHGSAFSLLAGKAFGFRRTDIADPNTVSLKEKPSPLHFPSSEPPLNPAPLASLKHQE